MNVTSYCDISFFRSGGNGSSYKELVGTDTRLESSIKINLENLKIPKIPNDVAKAHLFPYLRIPFKLRLTLGRRKDYKEIHYLINMQSPKNDIVRSLKFLRIHEEINNIALSCKAFYKATETERKFLKLVSIIYKAEKNTFFVPPIERGLRAGRYKKLIIRPPDYQGE